MSAANMVPETTEALQALEKLLLCMSCETNMKCPVVLIGCDHVFCMQCLKDKGKCPLCGVPVWVQDLKVNKQLEDISNVCAQIRTNLSNVSSIEKDNELHKTPAKSICKESSLKGNNEKQAAPFATPEMNTPAKAFRTPGTLVTPKCLSTPRQMSLKTPKSGQKNKKGETELHIAAIRGNIMRLTALLEEGVDVNLKDNAGWSALHEASIHGHAQIVEKLIDHGALVDIPGHGNDTPLMDAVANNKFETVRMLLKCGADVNLRNAVGKTAKSFAKNEEMLKLLSNKSPALTTSSPPQIVVPSPLQAKLSCSSSVASDKVKAFVKLFPINLHKDSAIGVTHFVTCVDHNRKAKRTIKYLQAMASGAWILTENWLDACVKQVKWVEELDYQVKSCVDDGAIGGPLRSTTSRLRQVPRLFDGCHFFLHGAFSQPYPTKQQLTELIKAADGKILSRSPKPDSDCVQICSKVPYHVKPDSPAYYFTYYTVFDPSKHPPPRMVKQGKVNTVPVTWVLDCLTQFIIIS